MGTGICLALSLWLAAGSLRHSPKAGPLSAQEGINPNDAPVASLMRLPQIGAARARAIVIYRDAVRSQTGQPSAFTRADDLDEIKGIGPAIVEGLRPWLQFDDPPSDGNAPAER